MTPPVVVVGLKCDIWTEGEESCLFSYSQQCDHQLQGSTMNHDCADCRRDNIILLLLSVVQLPFVKRINFHLARVLISLLLSSRFKMSDDLFFFTLCDSLL